MITKLILPVAGLGTRLRPLTLTTPKNLIPVAGRPLLEYALDEAVLAGIKNVVLVVSPENLAQYDEYLASSARQKYPQLNFHIRVQEKPWGHGHAVLQAADVVGGEPFLVRFCDDIIVGGRPILKTLAQIFEEYGAPVLLLERVPKEEVGRYGVVKAQQVQADPKIWKIFGFMEKPKPEEAPSNLVVIGGYALTPEVMAGLKRLEGDMRRENDSLLITDPLVEMMVKSEPIYPVRSSSLQNSSRARSAGATSNGVYGWEFGCKPDSESSGSASRKNDKSEPLLPGKPDSESLAGRLRRQRKSAELLLPGKRLDCGTLAGLKAAEEYLQKRKSQNYKLKNLSEFWCWSLCLQEIAACFFASSLPRTARNIEA